MKFNKLFVILAISMLAMASLIRIRRSETDTEAERKKKSKDKVPECFGEDGKLLAREVFNEKATNKKFDEVCKDQEGYVAAADANLNKNNSVSAPEAKKKF